MCIHTQCKQTRIIDNTKYHTIPKIPFESFDRKIPKAKVKLQTGVSNKRVDMLRKLQLTKKIQY